MLTILAVIPFLAVLLVMAAQPLFELWDARASERTAAAADDALPMPEIPATALPTAFPESLGDVSAVLSAIPHPRRPAPVLRAVR
ncbi:hypothetical protein C8E95_3380 [Pseudonocardia autotrophica]|uniref:Uncharacterized protein n=1 Tax=Pseudonocardia autotrophica TaxID=2074 RepID=A0A1Y2N945_PSEAH|nr:hypothetical protein BG845_00125 [Pseudonocardia autotrophica]TDN74262.1 hypothetical protein C8E95_3380 [Pseudonocardia autotrophica]